jgi:hypothetical protein
MARISVSVPDEMKDRMDALGDRVNWSEAARSAFEREMTAATMPDDPDLEQVIERLRASKSDFAVEWIRRAREDGRDWAKRWATYEQLWRIAKLQLFNPYYKEVNRALGYDEDPQCSPLFHDSEEWPENEYVEAWVEGAKDVWIQVADKI